MTGTEYAAVIAGIVTLIAAIGAAVVNIIVALRTSAKVEEVSAKADVISGHVNSSATAATAKIDALEKQVVFMAALLNDQKTVATALAASTAATALATAVPAMPVTTAPEPVRVEVVNTPLDVTTHP